MLRALITILMLATLVAMGLAMAPHGICLGCANTGKQCTSDFSCGFGCACVKLAPSKMYGICVSDW